MVEFKTNKHKMRKIKQLPISKSKEWNKLYICPTQKLAQFLTLFSFEFKESLKTPRFSQSFPKLWQQDSGGLSERRFWQVVSHVGSNIPEHVSFHNQQHFHEKQSQGSVSFLKGHLVPRGSKSETGKDRPWAHTASDQGLEQNQFPGWGVPFSRS